MNVLRFVLLGLAAVVLVTLGWRLASAPHGPATSRVPTEVAMAPAAKATVPPVPTIVAPSEPQAEAIPPLAATPPSPTEAAPATTAPAPASLPAADATPAGPGLAVSAQDAHAKIVAALDSAPDLARAFDALKAQFPAVADRTLAAATETYRTSGTLPSPDDLFAEAMRDLRLSAGVLAAKAGPDALGAIFEAKAKVLADLEQADPRICADYIYGGTSPEFADFQAGHRALIAANALATIEAMADGRARQKTWPQPSADDFNWIEGALGKRGLSSDEVAALLDGRSPATPPTDTRLCDNARTYLDVLKSMPADGRNRIYGLTAELLARS
jgi:hypothetical protein